MPLLNRLFVLGLASLVTVSTLRASARGDWKQVVATIAGFAAEGAKSSPDQEALGNQANLLKFQLENFVAAHPDDKEAWTARILLPEVSYTAAQAIGSRPDWRETAAAQAALCADPALPEKKRADAAFSRISFLIAQQAQPDFTAEDRRQAIALMRTFVRDNAWHKAAEDVALSLGQLLVETDPDGAREALVFAKRNRDPEKANQAERELAVLPYRRQPLDLKFTTFDGRELDLASLRGKVVVVDFWATWCRPCMSEVPRLVALYHQYHDRGVEIVGISFDDSASDLKAGLARHGMTWPQYFDGGGWDNKIGDKFAITSIPTMWVLDRSGRVITTRARVDSLERYLQPLLCD